MPRGRKGAHRVDDRRVISGIVHMLRSERSSVIVRARLRPLHTIYNRFNRWSRQSIWFEMFERLTESGTVRNFVRKLGMIGAKEPDNAATQRTSHTPALDDPLLDLVLPRDAFRPRRETLTSPLSRSSLEAPVAESVDKAVPAASMSRFRGDRGAFKLGGIGAIALHLAALLLSVVVYAALLSSVRADAIGSAPSFRSFREAAAATIPASASLIQVQGLNVPGDTGVPMTLARGSPPPDGTKAPWIYRIGTEYWQLQNAKVTPQMLGYPGRFAAIEAIAEAGNYCNVHPGCHIELPAGDYTAVANHTLAMIQNADWEIDFDQGAKIVAGSDLRSSVLLIKDGKDGKAQAHTLIIRKPAIDMTAAGESADHLFDNAAIDVTGQKSVQIIDPVLIGGSSGRNRQSGIGIAMTGVVDGEITGGTLRGFFNTAIYPEGYNIQQRMPENSVVTITGTCFYDNGQVVAAKRQLKLLVINHLCADRNDRGVGTYPAGGPPSSGYAQATEPAAQRVIINGGYIHNSPSRAIEFRDGTTGVINDLDIQVTGVTSDGKPVPNCEAVQLIGARDVQFNRVRIALTSERNLHCVAILSDNDQVLGHTFVSQGHNSRSATGGISIIGYRYGYYEGREAGPSQFAGVGMTGVAVPLHLVNPSSSVQYKATDR
jgi:transposase